MESVAVKLRVAPVGREMVPLLAQPEELLIERSPVGAIVPLLVTPDPPDPLINPVPVSRPLLERVGALMLLLEDI